MGRINIEVDDDVHRMMKSHCALQGIGLQQFVNDAVRTFLRRQKRGDS